MKKIILSAFAACALFAQSCTDHDVLPQVPMPQAQKALILTEGTFQNSESKLISVSLDSFNVNTDAFGAANNGAPLGNLGNDMLKYGSKIYIALNFSKKVAVIDAKTLRLLSRIDMSSNATGSDPRYLASANGNVYVSCQNNKVAIIDTTTFVVKGSISVGQNPEQMAVANNKLFVANSGGFNYPNYDSTVSVIDLASNTVVQKITAGINPALAYADGNAVFIGCYGNYGNIKPRIVRIDATTNTITNRIDSAAGKMAIANNKLLVATGYAGGNLVSAYNPQNLALISRNFITDNSSLSSPYGIGYEPVYNNVWVLDAMNFTSSGVARVYNAAGAKKRDINLGAANPNTVIFY